MQELQELLDEIDAYCAARGIKHSTFGQQVAQDRGLVERMRNGGKALEGKIERLYQFMRDNPPSEPERESA